MLEELPSRAEASPPATDDAAFGYGLLEDGAVVGRFPSARTRGLEGLLEGLGGAVPRGALTGDPRRCTRAADGSASGVCIVPTAPHEVSRATSPDSKILAPSKATHTAADRTDFGQRSPSVFSVRSAPHQSVMGGSKQHDATAPGATARRRKSKPARSRPASAARVPLTSAKQLIFGRKIGEGTQGEVRLARHATTGKRYVVKILDLDDPDDPSTISSRAAANDAKRQVSSLTDEEARAVETEADCLRMLSHPNVVRCHGTFRLDPTADDPTSRRRSRLCIVMSHCEGGDLATLLARTKGQPLPEDAVIVGSFNSCSRSITCTPRTSSIGT